MRVSIVVPTYNGSRHLPTLLACLRMVSGALLAEVLICDDGSTEDTCALVRRHGIGLPAVYLRQERNGPRPGAARNLGIAASTGDVVLFIDQDVSFRRGFVADHIERHRNAVRPHVVVGFRQRAVQRAGARSAVTDDHRRALVALASHDTTALATPWYFAYSCNLSIPSELRNERFDESFRGWGNEDLDYAYRLWRQGAQIVFAPELTVFHADDRTVSDPFLSESRGRQANFTSFVLNTVRMLAKYCDDPVLTETLRSDLGDFAIQRGALVRSPNAHQPDAVVRWAIERLNRERC